MGQGVGCLGGEVLREPVSHRDLQRVVDRTSGVRSDEVLDLVEIRVRKVGESRVNRDTRWQDSRLQIRVDADPIVIDTEVHEVGREVQSLVSWCSTPALIWKE